MTQWRALAGSIAAASMMGAVMLGPPSQAAPTSAGPIVFESENVAGDHTQADLWSISTDATSATNLTGTPNLNEFGASWSPNGKRIAFWRTKAPFGPGNLWVMDASTLDLRRLTVGVDARDPDWNPAGTRLVYDAHSDLYTLRVSDGRDRVQITDGPASDFEPAWSPDGTRIAFTRGFEKGDVGDIYLLDYASGTVSRVTRSIGYDHQVGWSPNGRRLVFERDFDQRSLIVTVRPNGTDLTTLTHGQFFDVGPGYSPDGTQILFGSNRGGQKGDLGDLWIMSRTGADLRRFLDLPGAQGFAEWHWGQE